MKIKSILIYYILIMLSCTATKKKGNTYNDFDINKGFFYNPNVSTDKKIYIKKREGAVKKIIFQETDYFKRHKCRVNIYDGSPYFTEYFGISDNPFVYPTNMRLGVYQHYSVDIINEEYVANIYLTYRTLFSQQLKSVQVRLLTKLDENQYHLGIYNIGEKNLKNWNLKSLYFNYKNFNGTKIDEGILTVDSDSLYIRCDSSFNFIERTFREELYTNSKSLEDDKYSLFWYISYRGLRLRD